MPMSGHEHSSSRPTTPDSPITNVGNTIDDLTAALANFSRVPSPEPPSLLTCCCGRENCENMTAWLNMKSRLESRLILSAEVGQALLQRHERYVRQQKRRQRSEALDYDDELSPQEEMERRLVEIGRERDALEKRLTQALVNNEVTEVSNKTILQELQETKTTVSRLSAHHARSVKWETRMSAAMKERDDMQQERDFESHRARVAESRFAALKDKTSRLQADVRRLQDDLAEKRMHRLESSESILQDARSQLEALQRSLSPSVAPEQTELTKVLESLMDDNEVLKRDTAELQHFLAESREEIHALQEEVEEYRANAPSRSGAATPRTPTFRQHFHSGSMPSSVLKEQTTGKSGRGSSMERKFRKPYDLITPESHVRPLSPTESESKWSSFNPIQPQPRRPISPYQIEVADDGDQDVPVEFTKGNKPLLLLSRSRGVQTDPVSDRSLLSASPSPLDPRSDSSSYSESSSNMAQLIERVVSLLNRLQQADAFTLTSRLKRQHLRGADVAHLSRSTINNVLSEAAALRVHFRAFLEDEKLVTTCNRRDLRALLKLFRDIFTEMGQMRVTLNEIILDPSIAPKVSEMALDPSKSDVLVGKERGAENNVAAAGWMAPISKLFGSASVRPENGVGGASALMRSVSAKGPARPARFVPKLGPALSASATTVNVEFSGAGVGRAVTSTSSAHPSRPGPSAPQASTSSAQGVMGIFAGAPRSSTPDPWVVVPKGPRRVQSTMPSAESPGLRRTHAAARSANRMSRNVDAILDIQQTPTREDQESEEPDYLGPLLEHKLRRRGLSDSSIHSTYISQAAEDSVAAADTPRRDAAWPDRGSVLQALSRRVQNFRLGPTTSGGSSDAGVSPGASSTDSREREREREDKSSSYGIMPIPGLSHWTAATGMSEASFPPPDTFFGSPTRVDESGFLERTQRGDFY